MSNNGNIGMVLAILCVIISIGFSTLNYNLQQQNQAICNASPSCYSSSVASSISSSISSERSYSSFTTSCNSLSSQATGNESGALQYLGSTCPGGATNLVQTVMPIGLGIMAIGVIGVLLRGKVNL